MCQFSNVVVIVCFQCICWNQLGIIDVQYVFQCQVVMVVSWRNIICWVEMDLGEWICDCLQGFYVVVSFSWEEFEFF